MKRRPKSLRRFLDQSFARLFKAPPSPEDSAWERVLERLREEPEGASRNAQVALDSVRPIRPTVISSQLWAVAAAAMVVLAVALSVAFLTVSAPATVENVEGEVQRLAEGKTPTIETGEAIQLGEIIRSNGGAGRTLKLVDGSRVEMRSQSELLVEQAADGLRIQLRRGDIIVNAAKQQKGRHLYVQTKDVTVSVVGTVFLVRAEEKGSRVSVIEGEVQVAQGAIETKLRPGGQVITSQSMETQSVADEISWSRNAGIHLAMLQQNKLTADQTILRVSGVVHRTAISPGTRLVLVRLVGPNGTKEVTATYSGMIADPLFEFRDIVPGSYRLDIRTGGVATPIMIDVVDKPVTDILLGGPIVRISGSMNFEPGPIGPHMKIVFTNAKPGGAEISGSLVRSSFTVEVPPGEYRVTTRRTPAGYTVESIISGRKDLLKETLQVDANNPPTIEIKLRR